jgi:uncharacterized membrane protein YeiH
VWEDLWEHLLHGLEEAWSWFTESYRRGGEFELPVYFSLLAYFTFGVTGALAGLRRGYDVIGVLFLATITAGGGGLIRDGLLISSGPASLLTDGRPMILVVVAAVLTHLFHRYVDRLNRTIAVIDALGLGAFAVHGVQRSLQAGLSVPAAVLGGTITAVGGGLLRDILVRDEPLLFKPGQFYALVAIGGSGLFIALQRLDWMTPINAALTTIVVVFAFRMLSIRFNWRTSALYHEPTQPPQPPQPPP